MDKFFSQTTCDRCGGSLKNGRIMSMFNNDCICMSCKDKEREKPTYKQAVEAERAACLAGNMNFPGIGL